MKTPYFLISEEKLNTNISSFREALDKYWPNSAIAYSVKTNSLPWLLKYMKAHEVMAEVVSDEEYQLAKLSGYNDNEIVFNGPIKGEKTFEEAIIGHALINLDSQHDLDYISKEKGKQSYENIGIRINLNTSLFEEKDIGYEKDGFRFGFSESAGRLSEVINLLEEIYGNRRIGLHLHCNSVTRSTDVYATLAQYASEIIERYGINPPYIDIGGGFFGGVEGKPSADNYISIIADKLSGTVNFNTTKLIIEPGSAIIGSVVDLYTSVIDVKDTELSRIVTTDGSRIHVDPLWKKNRYMYSLEAKNTNVFSGKQIICGYTCMDHDRIMELMNEPELALGDEIIYHRVGAYSVTFGGLFIRYFPEVYVQRGKEIKQVRKRIGVDEYYKLQGIMEEG